ncbi:MAG: AAA family ATPase [Hyphomonas sp.]
MLESLHVKGFRSLNPLFVEFRPGLNVFVGANGSGKSNLISFLNFLHNLSHQSIHHVVERAGGISRVFSRENVDANVFELSFSVKGKVTSDSWTSFTRKSEANGSLDPVHYVYAAEIVFDFKSAILFIKKEAIKIIEGDGGSLAIERRTSIQGEEIATKIRFNERNHPYTNMLAKRSNSLDEFEDGLANQTSNDASILSVFGFNIGLVSIVRSELSALSLVNVDPNKVRDSDSLTDYPFVEPDGSGTIPTLFALSSDTHNRHRSVYYGDATGIFNSITSWSKEVMQELVSIDVSLDARNLKYSAFITLENANGAKQTFPFSTLSDGTLKWISLVTILFTSGGQFTIEEPENFLHPRMQRTLVALLRSALKSQRKEQFL